MAAQAGEDNDMSSAEQDNKEEPQEDAEPWEQMVCGPCDELQVSPEERELKKVPDPSMPTRKEIDDHERRGHNPSEIVAGCVIWPEARKIRTRALKTARISCQR